jgi:membrane protein
MRITAWRMFMHAYGYPLGRLVARTLLECRRTNALRLSAALSYYTVFSMAPILLLVTSVAGLVYGQDKVLIKFLAGVRRTGGPKAEDIVQTMIAEVTNPEESLKASIVGFVTFFIGVTALFVELKDDLNLIWRVDRPHRSMTQAARDRLLSFGLAVALGLAILGSIVANVLVLQAAGFVTSYIPFLRIDQVHNMQFASFLSLVLTFSLIYKMLPDAHVSWRDVWVGSIATASLFLLGQRAIGWYIQTFRMSVSYSIVGAFTVFLTWLYYSSIAFFLGAHFTYAYSSLYGSHRLPRSLSAE